LASRYKIAINQVQPDKAQSEKNKKIRVPRTYDNIRASLVGKVAHFDFMHKAGYIQNVVIVDRDVGICYSAMCPLGDTLIRAEFDIKNPKSAWAQKHLKSLIIKGDQGFETSGTYDNEFKLIYPENLEQLENINPGALKEHLQKFYEQEWEAALGKSNPKDCSKGGEHLWSMDRQHSKEFCKKCFKSKKSDKGER